MRGVFLRGRRLPANRSAGPARSPVVPAAVPRRSRRSCGQRLGRRPQDRARRAVPAGPPPAGVLLPAKTPLMRAPPAGPGSPEGTQPGGARYMTGTTTAAYASADSRWPAPTADAASLPARAPSPAAAGGPARTAPARGSHLAAGPGRGQGLPGRYLPTPAPGPVVPRKPASRALAGPCPGAHQALSAPLSATASAGPWPLPSRTRSGAGLAGQHLAGTGYGPDLCRYRQPGATSCRACRMFPIACYGLTPRCR